MSQDHVWLHTEGSGVDWTVRRAEQTGVGVTRRLGGRLIGREELELWTSLFSLTFSFPFCKMGMIIANWKSYLKKTNFMCSALLTCFHIITPFFFFNK